MPFAHRAAALMRQINRCFGDSAAKKNTSERFFGSDVSVMVDLEGFEPLTSALRTQRSPS